MPVGIWIFAVRGNIGVRFGLRPCPLNVSHEAIAAEGTVSIHCAFCAVSDSTSRRRCTAEFRLWSKSTNVSSDQSWTRSSSRVTSSPGRSISSIRMRSGCSPSLIRVPNFRTSPERKST